MHGTLWLGGPAGPFLVKSLSSWSGTWNICTVGQGKSRRRLPGEKERLLHLTITFSACATAPQSIFLLPPFSLLYITIATDVLGIKCTISIWLPTSYLEFPYLPFFCLSLFTYCWHTHYCCIYPSHSSIHSSLYFPMPFFCPPSYCILYTNSNIFFLLYLFQNTSAWNTLCSMTMSIWNSIFLVFDCPKLPVLCMAQSLHGTF